MRRNAMISRAAFAALFATALVGCSSASTPVPSTPTPAASASVTASAANDKWIRETLAHLTLREKIGQMVVPRISGAYMPIQSAEYERLYDWVVRQGVGGVIITQGPPLELAAKLNVLQSLARVPLLVSADMESGPGQILTTGTILPYGIDNGSATRFPPLMGLGATGDEHLAYELGRITAQEARAVGVHITYAPVVDVNNNPSNPIINTRSYGEDPAAVARMARAHIRGLQDNGLIATAKHFPGHGDTGSDSHINLPVITVQKARADSVELPPYRAAIESGVGAIMTAHIAFPALTGDSIPATLNPKILTGLLRDELHYQGLIVTDAMDMGAIIKNYGATNSAIMAVKAGADQLLQPLPQHVVPMIDSLTAAVQRGEISEARIDESVRKLLQAKAWLGLDRERTVDLAKIADVVAKTSSMDTAQLAADRSITVARDRQNLLPLRPARVLSVIYADDYDPFTGRVFQRTLGAALPGLQTATLDANADSAAVARVAAAIDSADVVLFSPFIRVTAYKGELAVAENVAALINQTVARKPTIVTSFGNPYVLMQFPEISTYVLAWGQWDVSQRAAARALTGQIPITGRLPIAIPPFHKIGEGIEVKQK
ncbi:MAG TPA: glycoside hydrolase family 3 N-terminal domain-containing protein [Longimicrobiales bacterium]